MDFGLEPSPFCDAAFLLTDPQLRPGRHAYHHAGVFYVQEPSASVPAGLLGVRPGERVLDLCAAPGGKTSQLAAALRGEGLLVANEYVAARAGVLKSNLERMGAVSYTHLVPYEFSWLSGETPPTDAEMKAEIERRRAARAAEETAQAEEKAPETEESGGASGVREQREAEADTQAAPEEEQAAPAQEAAADAAEKDGSDAEPKE